MKHRYLEVIPALFLILWGLWVANPMWETFHVSSVYCIMDKLASEWIWGIIYLMLGLIQLMLTLTDHLRLRQVSSMVSIFILLSLVLFSAFGDIRSVLSPIYFCFVVCEWLAYTEIVSEIKEKVIKWK